MRGGDEGASWRPGEDDIARLIADEKSTDDVRSASQSHDTHAIGKEVGYPDLRIRSSSYRNRFEADGDAKLQNWLAGCEIENLERAIGRVHRKQGGPIGRHRDRTNMAAFELHKRGACRRRGDRGPVPRQREQKHSKRPECR